MNEHFGEHITIDGYKGDKDLLDNKDHIYHFLNKLPEKLGMTLLAEPTVVFAPSNHHKDPGGWSGFVVIAESHISIHSFPNRGFLSADAYTCKNGLDTDAIIKHFKEAFGLQEVEINFIKRGLNYPTDNIF